MILTWEIGRFCSSLWLLQSNLSYCIVLIAWCCLILLCIACVWFLTCICILPFGYLLSDPGLNLAMRAASCSPTNLSVNQDTRFNSVNHQVKGQDYHIRNWEVVLYPFGYQATLCIALYLMMVMVLCGLALHCMVFDFWLAHLCCVRGFIVAPTSIGAHYLTQIWSGGTVLSVIWFLYRWKSNVFARIVTGKAIAGADRERYLTMDRLSSIGLLLLGGMAFAEACGVAVQSILTVGGIGGT